MEIDEDEQVEVIANAVVMGAALVLISSIVIGVVIGLAEPGDG